MRNDSGISLLLFSTSFHMFRWFCLLGRIHFTSLPDQTSNILSRRETKISLISNSCADSTQPISPSFPTRLKLFSTSDQLFILIPTPVISLFSSDPTMSLKSCYRRMIDGWISYLHYVWKWNDIRDTRRHLVYVTIAVTWNSQLDSISLDIYVEIGSRDIKIILCNLFWKLPLIIANFWQGFLNESFSNFNFFN